ncbi:MAG: sensor histidine kinase [Anaerolineaceae bacterium]|nr:sensor histidine kinase [Anaerolineaceae bacterium]
MPLSISEPTPNSKNGDFAFALVVLSAFVVLITSQVVTIGSLEFFIILGLTLIYTFVGIYGSRRLDILPVNKFYLAAFFVVQISICLVISYFSKSSMWLLVLPTASQAVQSLNRPTAILACITIWLSVIVPMGLFAGWGIASAWGFALLAAIVFVAVFTQLATSETKARKELSLANQKLREYSTKVEQLATVQERNRLAREIHDGLGHYLTAINIQIKAAQSVIDDDPVMAKNSLSNAQKLAQDALVDVRRSISSLRSDPTTSRPLAETLQVLIDETMASGIEVELTVNGNVRAISPQVELALYRVAQESLTNVRKHAEATRVDLKLEYLEKKIRLQVIDNGKGVDTIDSGYGLVGVGERVEILKGTFETISSPGMGFQLTAEIPCE